MKIFIEKNGRSYQAYGGEIDQIEDVDLSRFVKKMGNDLEFEAAYHAGEFDFSNLDENDQEEIEQLLQNLFLKNNELLGGLDTDEDDFPFSSFNEELLLGDLH